MTELRRLVIPLKTPSGALSASFFLRTTYLFCPKGKHPACIRNFLSDAASFSRTSFSPRKMIVGYLARKLDTALPFENCTAEGLSASN
jgi:hypothetical protein